MADTRTDLPPTATRPEFPRALCADDARALSALQNWRGALAVLVQWLAIAAAAGAAIWSGHWLVYALAVIVIGTRQHALAILVHEATHYRLFTGRAVNDLAADLLLAYPIGISLSRYRPFHLDHHRFSYTKPERDPEQRHIRNNDDWRWPKSPGEAACILVMDLLGLNIASLWGLMREFSPWFVFFGRRANGTGLKPAERIRLAVFATVFLAALAITNGWIDFALLWLLPMATVASAVFRLRTISEHAGLAGDNELRGTRTVLPALIERLVVAPCNVSYHLEHHLYPSVPFYNLPTLHRRLLAEPEFRGGAHISRGYMGVGQGALHEVTRI